MQFQSAGMSNAGALAAAKIAQNFEAMEEETSPIRRPSLPSSTYAGLGSAGGNKSGSVDVDPWGNLAPSPNDLTPQVQQIQRRPSDLTPISGVDGLAQPPSARTWNNNDNPWG